MIHNKKRSLSIFLFIIIFSLQLISCERNMDSSSINHEKDPKVLTIFRNKLKTEEFSFQIKDSIQRIENDSLRLQLLFEYAYFYYQKEDYSKFSILNDLSNQEAIKLGDTSKIAESYWDKGNFFFKTTKSDSAYYYYNKAFTLYDKIDMDFYAGRMLLNMAIVQKQIKDYIGSEISTVEALKKIEPLEKPQQVYMAYNNLGILYNELGDHQKSLQYHNKALEYSEELNPIKKATTMNNIGVAYQNQNNYDEALRYYRKALENDSVRSKRPRLYAMLIDNIAYAQFLNKKGLKNVEHDMLKALELRKSIGHTDGIIVNLIHLGEYYLFEKDTSKARKVLLSANKLSKEAMSLDYYLTTLEKLSKISSLEKSNSYLREYKEISDSLNQLERITRDKFTRIKYETDTFISKNKELAQEKKWIMIIAFITILLGIMIYIIYAQRLKNKKLELEKIQQRSNEQIYNLMMSAQDRMEEGRNEARKRISQELHDGILSKFFGIRLNLQIFNEKNDDNSQKKRNFFIQELVGIENEIRNISHEINTEFVSEKKEFGELIFELVNEHRFIGKYSADVEIDPEIQWSALSNKIKVHIYRICQEALKNIDKYAKASNICLTLNIIGYHLELLIIDDGVGFNTSKSQKQGIGLKNIESRTTDMNGTYKIRSGSNGTRIEIQIPLK